MLQKRANPTQRCYEKIVGSTLDSMPHTSIYCVRSAPNLKTLNNSSYAASLPVETSLPKIQLNTRLTRSAVNIGSNSPYQPTRPDASNLQRSATPNSFNSTSKFKKVPLPQMKGAECIRSRSPRDVKNVSMSAERYLGTARSIQQPNTSTLHKSYPQYEAPSVPQRDQVQRYEEEQSNLHITRTMKRKSEIMSHRVDRLYYLSGSGFTPHGRYEVNEAELQRLREFSRARNNSRVNSGRSSIRSGRNWTESSVLSESRLKRSPLGSPLGSPRCTPIPSSCRDANVDLSVSGSGVMQGGDEDVKGHGGANPAQRRGRASSGPEDVDSANGSKNNINGDEMGDSKTKDISENSKTLPHRTEKGDGNEHGGGNDTGHYDHRIGVRGGEGDGQTAALHCIPTYAAGDSDHNDARSDSAHVGLKESMVDGDASREHLTSDGGAGGRGASGGTGSGEGKGDAGAGGADDEAGGRAEDDVGEHREEDIAGGRGDTNDSGTTESKNGQGDNDAYGGGPDGDGAHIDATDIADAVQGCHSTHGRDNEAEGGEEILPQDVDDSTSSKLQILKGRQIESIGPGLNVDKTAVRMRKSDVYLTEFTDPRRAYLGDNLTDDEMETESQIDIMERRLNKVASDLTQEIDEIGHVTGLDHDALDCDKDEEEYDAGVFAEAGNEEERMKALQRKEERKKERIALLDEQNEGRRIRVKAAKQRAEKQAKRIKFRMEDVYNFISSRQKSIFSQKFRELDTDGTGTITLKELVKKMHKNVPKEDIQHLHKVFDLNQDKTIDEREFVTIAALNDKLVGKEIESETAPLELRVNQLSLHVSAYKEMFDVVDQNGDGRLSMDEIMLIIAVSTGINITIDKEAVAYIHNTIDKDGNGSIDFVEFLAFIPFFQKIHQQIIGKPVTIEEIEEARVAIKKEMRK